jgi:ubiquinone/menaquinone biosynthesis C-methylase UbiE
LAEKNGVTIDYQVGFLDELNFEEGQFDAIALIYAHFPAKIKSLYHKQFDRFLKKNGTIIFESFSKKKTQLRRTVFVVNRKIDS